MQRFLPFVGLLYLLFWSATATVAQNVTTVTTFNQEHVHFGPDNKRTVSGTFNFPDAQQPFSQILMHFTIGCPSGGCDAWDRYGDVDVVHPTGVMDSTVAAIDTLFDAQGNIVQIDTTWNPPYEITENFEIFRFITPYGGSFSPAWSWTWTADVTDYRTLLAGEVTLQVYIDTWVNPGWEVSIEFEMTEGTPAAEAYKVVNLWNYGYLTYGNPNNSIENYLIPITLTADADAHLAKVRILNTGHGFGFTDNAAEFSPKTHHLLVNGTAQQDFAQFLWRDDCAENPLSPQAGTWQYDRAGWCPGSDVWPFDADISYLIQPTQPFTLDYNTQPFVNLCSPSNPNCTDADCAGGSCSGGGEPYYIVSSQLIYYRATPQYTLDAQLINLNNLPAVSCQNTFAPNVRLRNNGSQNLTSALLLYRIDDTDFQTYLWTGNLGFAQSELIQLPEINLYDAQTHSFEVLVTTPNNGLDENYQNDLLQTSFAFGNNTVTLTLTTDNYGSESSWEIADTDGNSVFTGAGFASLTTITQNLCLPNGCYRFIMRDSYGDGMDAPTDGYYQLTDADGNVLASLQQPNFGTEEITEFCVEGNLPFPETTQQAAGNQTVLQLYPNPSDTQNTQVSITFAAAQSAVLYLTNLWGKELQRMELPPAATHKLPLNLQNYPPGVYVVTVQSKNGSVSEKLVKW
ncbi:T9SS C-terminal target domain-containing protein [Sphingobacteriales bacterium UPWRP_1]|nr:hypothetical protein BVG80_14415 [Sphingobacteriales bacterium TSM_CSM]PSJ76593.1 T9SS C-terminal target domain-containing protein [Sphingobacteriales bacterium UPWRP_1]